MDFSPLKKIAGPVLGIVFVGAMAWIVVEKPFSASNAVGADVEHAPSAPAAGEPLPDFAAAIPMANAENGKMLAERCAACHDWTKGGPNKIGPNLYGVVGRAKAAIPGFDFSPALMAKGGTWTYADLFAYLKQPALFAPGNKMSFAGLPGAQDRLDLIAFLRMQADTPSAP